MSSAVSHTDEGASKSDGTRLLTQVGRLQIDVQQGPLIDSMQHYRRINGKAYVSEDSRLTTQPSTPGSVQARMVTVPIGTVPMTGTSLIAGWVVMIISVMFPVSSSMS